MIGTTPTCSAEGNRRTVWIGPDLSRDRATARQRPVSARRDVDVRVEDVGRVDAALDLAETVEDRPGVGRAGPIGRLVWRRVVHVRAADPEVLHPAVDVAHPADLGLVVLGPLPDPQATDVEVGLALGEARMLEAVAAGLAVGGPRAEARPTPRGPRYGHGTLSPR